MMMHKKSQNQKIRSNAYKLTLKMMLTALSLMITSQFIHYIYNKNFYYEC